MDREVTLLEVARLARVHPSTASRALGPSAAKYMGEKTHERVLLAAEELGYRPNALAQGLRRGRSGVIGVVVVNFEHPFTAAVLRGIEVALEARSMMPLITATHESSASLERAVEQLLTRRVDAIISLATRYGDEATVTRASREVPVVLGVRSLERPTLPTVAHDDMAGGELVAKHLLDLGHTCFAELAGPMDVSSFAQRHIGFSAQIARHGAAAPVVLEASSAVLEEGHRLAGELLDRAGDLPTAVFAHNDLLAVGVIDTLEAAGLRCPRDFSVVGYDDMLFADHLHTPLTTVQLPAFHLGRLAAEMAESLLRSPDSPPPAVSLPPTFVARASTAAPRPRSRARGAPLARSARR